MRLSVSHWTAAVLLALCLAGVSCNNKPAGLNPVEGQVLYQNEPLAGALVAFHPQGDDSIHADRPTGFTGPDGKFTLGTGAMEGAPAGKYVVTIICSEPVESTPGVISTGGVDTRDKLKGAYANRDASKIVVEIKDGPNQLPPFELQ